MSKFSRESPTENPKLLKLKVLDELSDCTVSVTPPVRTR